MINLLPPEHKEQLKYSRYNVSVVRYVLLVILVTACMSAILFTSSLFAKRQVSDLENQIEQQQLLLSDFDATLDEAKKINSKINTASDVFANESNFISFLEELEQVIPSFARLTSIELSHAADTSGTEAENEELLRAVIEVEQQQQVAVMQRTIENMVRVEVADTQSVQRIQDPLNEDVYMYQIDMLINLQARPGEVIAEGEE